MRTFALVVTTALSMALLHGCLSPEQLREQEAYRQSQREASQSALLEKSKSTCTAYGFELGTDAFANCVRTEMTEASAHSEAESRRKRSVEVCKSAMYGRPTRTGSFAESAANAAKCDSDPTAHVRMPEQAPTYTCKNGVGEVKCRPE